MTGVAKMTRVRYTSQAYPIRGLFALTYHHLLLQLPESLLTVLWGPRGQSANPPTRSAPKCPKPSRLPHPGRLEQ